MPSYVSRWLGRQRISPPLRPLASVRTFLFSCGVDFFPQSISKLVALLVELVEKVKALERDLEMTKANFSWNVVELAKSCEKRRALEGEFG